MFQQCSAMFQQCYVVLPSYIDDATISLPASRTYQDGDYIINTVGSCDYPNEHSVYTCDYA